MERVHAGGIEASFEVKEALPVEDPLVATSGLQQAVVRFVAVLGYLLIPEAAQNSVAVMLQNVTTMDK